MSERGDGCMGLPSPGQIRRAVAVYLDRAYGPDVPPAARRFIPPTDFDPPRWLMSDLIERDPADAPLPAVRSFALRIGNSQYPHMKLRLSRPPRDEVYLFSVDCHDGVLRAPPGSADAQALEALRRHNAAVAAAIHAAWDVEDLPTERSYLRRRIEQARQMEARPER